MFHFHPLEPFWVDVALQNPLDTEVTFTDLTLVVEARDKDTPWISEYITVERVKEVVLRAKENRMVREVERPVTLGTHTFCSISFSFRSR